MKAILTYHSVDDSGSVVSVSPEAFRGQIEALQRRGVRFVPLGEIEAAAADADCVALTFDDGFANLRSAAWPVLRDGGIPATVFVATDHVGGTNGWAGGGHEVPELPLMGWEELGELAEEGLEIGSHSRTHPDLRRLESGRLEDEVAGAAERIERELGRRPDAFAYPFGHLNARAVEAVRGTYRRAFTTELRALRPDEDPHRLPRLDAFYFRNTDRLAGFGSPTFSRYIAMRATLRRARQLILEGVAT